MYNTEISLEKKKEDFVNNFKEISKTGSVSEIKSFLEISRETVFTDQKFILEVALKCAKQNSRLISIYIEDFGLKGQEDLFQVALECAKQKVCGSYIIKLTQNFGLENQEYIFKVALEYSKKSTRDIVQNIENLGLKNEKYLFQLALECGKQNGEETVRGIQNFGLKKEKYLYQVALECAKQNGWKTTHYIKRFGLKNKKFLYQVALECAKQNGWKTSENIEKFGIKNKDHLYQVALECTKQNRWKIAENIEGFGIKNKDHLYKLALECAKQNGWATARNIKKFGIKNKDHLYQVALKCAKDSGRGTSIFIKNFKLKNKKHLYQVVLECAKDSGRGVADNIENFGLINKNHLIQIAINCLKNDFSSRDFLSYFGFNIEENEQLLEDSLKKIFTKSRLLLKNQENIINYFNHPFLENSIEMFNFLNNYLLENNLISELLTLDNSVDNDEDRIRVLGVCIDTKTSNVDEALMKYSKLSPKVFKFDKNIPESLKNLRKVLLDIYCSDIVKFTENLTIESSIKRAEIVNIYSLLSSISYLNKEEGEKSFNISISKDNLKNKLSIIKKSLSTEFFKVTEIKTTGEALSQLKNEWGDLEPIITLISRFKKSGNKGALDRTLEIIKATLKQQFKELKYNKEELSFLKDSAKEYWKEDPVSLIALEELKDVKISQEQVEKDLLDNFKEIFNTNFINNIPDEYKEEKIDIREITLVNFSKKINKIDKEKRLSAVVQLIESKLDSYVELTKFMVEIQSSKQEILRCLEDSDSYKQIKLDLNTLKKSIEVNKKQQKKELLFTVITGHPKTLITVGDLVKTSSCQNYKTGGSIQTLPAYVGDSNIKAALGFVLDERFLKSKLGDELFNEMKNGNIKPIYDGAKNRFIVGEGVVPLTYASIRKIIRLGKLKSTDQAAALLERAYKQNSWHEKLIEEKFDNQIFLYLRTLGCRFDFDKGEEIEFQKTSNIDGVYSDRAGGIKKDAYTITI